MQILVIGGTRFMGKHLVNELLSNGHSVTIATRGLTSDLFGNSVKRIIFDRTDLNSIRTAFNELHFDIVFDNIAYCSEDVRNLLDHLSCERYIMLSTTAVYNKVPDTKETHFDPLAEKVIWCDRNVFPYAEMKQQAERALAQQYSAINSVSVRFPFVIGKDDYTKRLLFYIEHIVKQIPMYVDNYEHQMAFVRSDEAGRFLAYLADRPFSGKINGASSGTISIRDIGDYITKKIGKLPILSPNGDIAPYNGEPPYSIDTALASSIGFHFTPLHKWVYRLIDYYIEQVKQERI